VDAGAAPGANRRRGCQRRAVEANADEVRLTIERGSDPIAGKLDLPDGRRLAFEGYVQLVAALEAIRAPSPNDGSDPGGTR